MNLSGRGRYGVAAVLVVVVMFGSGMSHARAEGSRPSGWYIAVGAGASRAAMMKQAGHNDDTTCYPNDDCSHLPGGMPAGYNWSYFLHPDIAPAFELAIGRTFHPVRLELSVSRRTFDLEQEFTGLSYADGSARVPARDSGYASSTTAGVDDLTVHALLLSAYYDVPLSGSRVTLYLGAGVGLSFAELSGLHYRSRYACADDVRCRQPERYNGRQNVDLTDTVPSVHAHAGFDYRLGDRLLLGLKLTSSWMDDMRQRDAYADHAVPGMTSFTRISGVSGAAINYGTLLLTVKYLLGSDPVSPAAERRAGFGQMSRADRAGTTSIWG